MKTSLQEWRDDFAKLFPDCNVCVSVHAWRHKREEGRDFERLHCVVMALGAGAMCRGH